MLDANLLGSLIESISQLPIAAIVTANVTADNAIVAANRAFLAMTGYSANEVIGQNCRFLAGVNTESAARRVAESDRNRSPDGRGNCGITGRTVRRFEMR